MPPKICLGCTLPLSGVICVASSAACTLLAGIGILAMADGLVREKIHDSLAIVPGSPLYLNWVKLPLAIVNSYYLFNVTNARALEEDPALTLSDVQLEEIGPYVFHEYRTKDNMVWNDMNDTVSFNQWRVFHFSQEDTANRSLDDPVVSLNPVVAALIRKLNMDSDPIVASVIKTFHDKFIFPEGPAGRASSNMLLGGTVGGLLFGGIHNTWYDMGEKEDSLLGLGKIPKKISYFHEVNNSVLVDKHQNMYTGSKDVGQLGTIGRWEYSSYVLSHWPRPGDDQGGGSTDDDEVCGKVNGSSDYFSPHLDKTPVDFFATDLCRPMRLKYVGTEVKHGIEAYKYRLDKGLLRRWSSSKELECFRPADEWDHLYGIFDTSQCRTKNAPIYMSLPHFYKGHKVYRKQFKSKFKARREKHETTFYLEPVTGLPVQILARFQLNLRVEPPGNENFTGFERIPQHLIFPVMWIEQKAIPPPHVRNEIWLLKSFRRVVNGAGIFFILLASSFMVILFIHIYNRYIGTTSKKK